MSTLEQVRADHEAAVLAFELENRSYFSASVSDRGDGYFDRFAEDFRDLLIEQEVGTSAFYVLVDRDKTVLGRFNLYDACSIDEPVSPTHRHPAGQRPWTSQTC